MIRDITLGQYYPVDSVLHRMDPRTKLFGTMTFIITLFFAGNPAVKGSVWVYGEGLESDFVFVVDQCQL